MPASRPAAYRGSPTPSIGKVGPERDATSCRCKVGLSKTRPAATADIVVVVVGEVIDRIGDLVVPVPSSPLTV